MGRGRQPRYRAVGGRELLYFRFRTKAPPSRSDDTQAQEVLTNACGWICRRVGSWRS